MRSDRIDILNEAIKLTKGDRQEEYGSFQQNMDDTADLWNSYIRCKYSVTSEITLTGSDVAFFMTLHKMVRTFQEEANPKLDTYVDAACYAAMAGEAAFYQASWNEGEDNV